MNASDRLKLLIMSSESRLLDVLSSLRCDFVQPSNGFMDAPFLYHHDGQVCGSDAKDPSQSRGSVSGTKNDFLRKVSSFHNLLN